MNARTIKPVHTILGENRTVAPEALELMRERGGTWAVYQNCDMSSVHLGHLTFLQYGEGRTFREPPTSHPDTPTFIGWRYLLVGYVSLVRGVIVDTEEERRNG
jgi:hypothetical protein